MEEFDSSGTEWILGGTRYGSETLAEMRAKGLVPPSEFKETWARAEAERAGIRNGGTPAMRRERVADVREAVAKVRQGYVPKRGKPEL